MMSESSITPRYILLATFPLASVAAQPSLAETFVCSNGFCVVGSDVLDNVLVEEGGVLLLMGTIVEGNVEVRNGGILAASGAMIAGNVEVNGNYAMRWIEIDGNIIGGNLLCEDNDPAPIGGADFVEGNVEGQCEGLAL